MIHAKIAKINYICVMDIRVGYGYDVHALAHSLPLIICGVKIEHEKGCVAHSDGDVAIHALCDAILGAMGERDIGYHFPDTSTEYKGIDSRLLLGRVNLMMKNKGYRIGNLDITIALQRPKIAPYIDSMRQSLSDVLEIEKDRISVKATTTEKLGFVGKEEGVEASAVVLIVKE